MRKMRVSIIGGFHYFGVQELVILATFSDATGRSFVWIIGVAALFHSLGDAIRVSLLLLSSMLCLFFLSNFC